MSFGFYFEADGAASRFVVEPVRVTAGGETGVGVQLTRRLLREIPYGELERAARKLATKQAAIQVAASGATVTLYDDHGNERGRVALDDNEEQGDIWRQRLADLDSQPETRSGRGGRPPLHSDAAYALMAYRYTSARQNPIEAVASEFHVSLGQARNLISTARKKGMLSAALPGRAGGQLTPLAAELLEAGNVPTNTKGDDE